MTGAQAQGPTVVEWGAAGFTLEEPASGDVHVVAGFPGGDLTPMQRWEGAPPTLIPVDIAVPADVRDLLDRCDTPGAATRSPNECVKPDARDAVLHSAPPPITTRRRE